MSALKEYRKIAGFKTAPDFAEFVGVPATTYARHEQCPTKIPIEKACHYANVLGITLDDLYERTPNRQLNGYMALKEKYRITDAEAKLFKTVERKRAFWDLDAEIEAYDNNDKARDNGGRLFDPTEEEVERILDEYLEWRYADFAIADEADDMRRAIQNVMDLIC